MKDKRPARHVYFVPSKRERVKRIGQRWLSGCGPGHRPRAIDDFSERLAMCDRWAARARRSRSSGVRMPSGST